jgi:hypothetical protein
MDRDDGEKQEGRVGVDESSSTCSRRDPKKVDGDLAAEPVEAVGSQT